MTASAASNATAWSEWRGFWTLPIAAAFGYSTCVLHTYGMGAFFAPIQQEFGWSRAETAFGITIAGIIAIIFAIPVGMMVDRFGPRIIGLFGVLAMTAAFALLGTATGDYTNWVVLWCVLGFANLWLQSTVWTSAVATRFEASRGLAFAVTFSGASISQTIFPFLSVWLIQEYGWRTGFMAMGGLWAVVVFPIMLLFFRGARDRGAKTAAVAQDAAALPGLTVPEGLRTLAFYQLFAATIFFAFTALSILVHFVPILTDMGATPLAAGGVASLVGIFSIIGRLGTGFLLDRLPGHIVGAVVFILPIIASALLLYDGTNPAVQMLAAAVFGLTVGAEVDVIGYLASRYFGLKNFGVFLGAMVAALSLGVAVGPLAAGYAYDVYDGYREFLVVTMIAMALSCLALATMGRPRFAGREGIPVEPLQAPPVAR